MEFFQQIILGIIQGIIEWMPISSEGFLLLVTSNFFGEIEIELFLRQALFLHLGTFFAALVYFRKEVRELIEGAVNYKSSDSETKRTLKFLFIATIISGIFGLAILNFIGLIKITEIPLASASVNYLIGFLLIITGLLQLKASSAGFRKEYHLNNTDGIFLGFMQGLTVLPGLSRSGLTISSFLFRNIDETVALRLSFIMSLPIVLLANIALNFRDFVFIKSMFFGFLLSFIFGFLTIHLLMEFSRKVKFGYFAIFFVLLAILAAVVSIL
jgi:undecaprenyl-diphosphatase